MTRCYIRAQRTKQHVTPELFPIGWKEVHYGYACEVSPSGELIADIPDDLLQAEISTGRAVLVEDGRPQSWPK